MPPSSRGGRTSPLRAARRHCGTCNARSLCRRYSSPSVRLASPSTSHCSAPAAAAKRYRGGPCVRLSSARIGSTWSTRTTVVYRPDCILRSAGAKLAGQAPRGRWWRREMLDGWRVGGGRLLAGGPQKGPVAAVRKGPVAAVEGRRGTGRPAVSLAKHKQLRDSTVWIFHPPVQAPWRVSPAVACGVAVCSLDASLDWFQVAYACACWCGCVAQRGRGLRVVVYYIHSNIERFVIRMRGGARRAISICVLCWCCALCTCICVHIQHTELLCKIY